MSALPTPAELSEQLRRWAARPSSWRPLVHHDPDERRFALLHRDERTEVYVVCWMQGHDTGFHDHEECAAALLVLDGAVHEQRLALGGSIGATVTGGGAIEVPHDAIHRVKHAGDGPAVTLHAYSPPLTRVGTYDVGAEEALVRRSRDAEVPLRPAAAGHPRAGAPVLR